MLSIPPEADEAVAKARAFVAAADLDPGPVVGCRHLTTALVQEMLQQADPNVPEYEIGVRVFAKWRDCWVIEFAKKLPVGVVECPATIGITVYEDTGELEFV